MKMQDVMEILREDVEVPDVVRKKAEEALEQIRTMQAGQPENCSAAGRKRRMRGGRKRMAACIAVAVLAVGGTCIASVYGRV